MWSDSSVISLLGLFLDRDPGRTRGEPRGELISEFAESGRRFA
jgi:hypothetical protein